MEQEVTIECISFLLRINSKKGAEMEQNRGNGEIERIKDISHCFLRLLKKHFEVLEGKIELYMGNYRDI